MKLYFTHVLFLCIKIFIFTVIYQLNNCIMNYSKNFKDIVINGNFVYLGHGNPNAKILIIGKEPRIDKNDPSKQEQLERDIYNNRKQWLNNLNDDTISYDT